MAWNQEQWPYARLTFLSKAIFEFTRWLLLPRQLGSLAHLLQGWSQPHWQSTSNPTLNPPSGKAWSSSWRTPFPVANRVSTPQLLGQTVRTENYVDIGGSMWGDRLTSNVEVAAFWYHNIAIGLATTQACILRSHPSLLVELSFDWQCLCIGCNNMNNKRENNQKFDVSWHLAWPCDQVMIG